PIEEDLVSYFQNFQNTSESSDESNNAVNAPREPFVVKQDHGVKSSQNPPPINECCCECGNALDGIFCQQCICKSCGKGAHIGYNCLPKQAANARYWKIPAYCDDDDDYDFAITPVLSTEETENSLSMGDEHLNTIPATESDEVLKSSVEDLVPIPREISSGSTTTHCDISLPDYEAFYFDDDHIKEISSGSTTTHSDISLSEYDSFIFEEFVDELAHIISPPEYDRFYFKDLPDPSELMSVLNSGIRENFSTTLVNLSIEDDHSALLAYVVWIFVAYLTYPVIHPYLYPFGNEDTIFDPGITINHFYSFEPVSSHRHGAFKKFNTHRSHLNEWPMIINGKNTPLLDVLLHTLKRNIVSPPLFLITSLGIFSSHLLNTPKTTPPPFTYPPPAPSQPSKQTSPLAINLDPVELIFSTPPASPHPFFDSLEDLPPRTTNLRPPQPSFETIERLANQPPSLLAMEPPLQPMPPHLPPLGPNNTFLILTHEMSCDHCQPTQDIINDLRKKMRFILNNILECLNVLAQKTTLRLV
nr:hypothetical protein [Tanacetum cinerariifolium]